MPTHPADLDRAAFIIQVVCNEFCLGIDELESPERTERVTWPRWLAIFLVAKYTQMAWPVIGALFNRTPSSVRKTICHSVPNRIETEPKSRNKLFQLESYILDRLRRPAGSSLEPTVGRGEHETILFRGRLIPMLGTVGGTPEESRQTARNIERFLAANK